MCEESIKHTVASKYKLMTKAGEVKYKNRSNTFFKAYHANKCKL